MSARGRKNEQPQGDFPFVFGSQVPGVQDVRANVPGQEAHGTGSTSGKVVDQQSFGFDEKRAADKPVELFKGASAEAGLGPDYGREKRRLRRDDSVSVYAAQMNARYAMDHRKRTTIILLVLALVMIPLLVILPGSWLKGSEIANGVAGFAEHLGGRVTALGLWIQGSPDGVPMGIFFWQTATVAVVGAVLAMNGAVFQGALKNALASPTTLGVVSGGTLGSVIYTLLFEVPVTEEAVTYVYASELSEQLSALDPLQYFFAVQGRFLFSLVGCMVVTVLVLLVAYIAGRGKVSKVALIIAGQVFTAFASGVVTIIRYYVYYNGTDQQQAAIMGIMSGSVDNVMGFEDFALIAIPAVIGFAIILHMRFKLNLLAFDEAEAKSLGIKTNVTRNTVMIVCTVLTAVVVSFCGTVGFVGFLIPHIARRMVGPDFRFLLPCSACLGAVFLLLVNYVMHLGNFFSGSLGTFTSIIGAVFFFAMVVVQRRRGNVDWV